LPTPDLKVDGLTVYQGNYLALRDVSFELLPGTDTAVVGPMVRVKVRWCRRF
jgi:zinc/manganese transport system ATP-binding protein